MNESISAQVNELEALQQQAESISNPFQAVPIAKQVIQLQSALISYLVKEVTIVRDEMKLILGECNE